MYVEFLGLPRERVGISEMEVRAETLGQLLTALTAQLPGFAALVAGDHRLHPSIAANLNGDRFVSDLGTALADDDHVLILSADAGG